MNTNTREKEITKTSIVGIIANIFLAAFKALMGMLSGSIAIILDAVNNLTDALSSVITIAGIKLSKRKPDENHPYGFGRIEYFSSLIIGGIILAAGISSLSESVKGILHPTLPDYDIITLIIIIVAIIVKLIMGSYVTSQGRKYNSDALVASGQDAKFDAVISSTTLICAVIALIFKISLDGITAAVISLFIIKAGIETLLESLSNVIGTRPDSEITLEIKKTIREIPGVLGAYDLVLHNYGPDSAIGSVHIEIPDSLSANEIHKLTKRIQVTIVDKFQVFLTVGIYSVDSTHAKERKAIHEAITSFDGVLGTHGYYIDDESKYASMDVLIDFSIADKETFAKKLTELIAPILPGYKIEISFDTNYSS